MLRRGFLKSLLGGLGVAAVGSVAKKADAVTQHIEQKAPVKKPFSTSKHGSGEIPSYPIYPSGMAINCSGAIPWGGCSYVTKPHNPTTLCPYCETPQSSQDRHCPSCGAPNPHYIYYSYRGKDTDEKFKDYWDDYEKFLASKPNTQRLPDTGVGQPNSLDYPADCFENEYSTNWEEG